MIYIEKQGEIFIIKDDKDTIILNKQEAELILKKLKEQLEGKK